MLVKKTIFYFALFFFVFNTNFTFFPYPTRVVTALMGAIVFFICIVFHPNIRREITRSDKRIMILFLALLGSALFSILVNRENDFSFYKEECIILMVVPFLGAYLVAYVGQDINWRFRDVLKSYININVVQSAIIIAVFFNSTFKQFLIDIQRWNTRTEFLMTYGGRTCGIGARFDYGSIIISISLISTVFLYFIERKSPLKYIGLYTIQALAGLLLARSIIIGIVCSIVLFLWMDSKRILKIKIIIRICIIVGILVGLCIVFQEQLQLFVTKYDKTIKWAFEFFFSDELAEQGKTTNSWTVILNDMYFIPDKLKTWFIGDGRYSTAKGNPYMNTDPLYMRYILLFGLPGLIVFLSFFGSVIHATLLEAKRFSTVNILSRSDMQYFERYIFVIAMFLLATYFKSNTHAFYFLFFIFFFFKLQNRKSRFLPT